MDGGLINLINQLVDRIKNYNGTISLRHEIQKIEPFDQGFEVSYKTNKETGSKKFDAILSAIPINNLNEIGPFNKKNKPGKLFESEQVVSAFQMGIAFNGKAKTDIIHHQIHLDQPLPEINSSSIFLSLNHPDDFSRTPEGMSVASISTHVHNPAHTIIEDKDKLEQFVLDILDRKGYISRDSIVFYHSSTPGSWQKWTNRKWGMVGGYPQYNTVKPWQMNGHRTSVKGLYTCGDTTYPGQGIPGAVLSGIIAEKKMMLDS
jgi:phytoene dehydrogenase-like protein